MGWTRSTQPRYSAPLVNHRDLVQVDLSGDTTESSLVVSCLSMAKYLTVPLHLDYIGRSSRVKISFPLNFTHTHTHTQKKGYLVCSFTRVPLPQVLRWHSGKESTCQCRRLKSYGFNPWVRKIAWRRKWQPTPIFFPEDSMDWQAPVHGVSKNQTCLSN